MEIVSVPSEFQPNYRSTYPEYSSGKNIEELFFNLLYKNKNNISSNYIYLPIFWTSYYVTNNYAENIDNLYKYLDTLDKSKKYFTIVQYAAGIFVKNFDLDLFVFTAGGGGLNIKDNISIRKENFFGFERYIFFGNKGNIDIPLLCYPLFPCLQLPKTIFCSFMGRFDTHPCRIIMKNILQNNNKFLLYDSVGFEEYKNILNKSIFTLAPRGYGYTSFRIYEAILANSIPIYIWDDKKVLPFSDILHWDEFSICIHSSEIQNLPTILNQVNIIEMQKKLNSIKYMFSFNETFNYIKNKLI